MRFTNRATQRIISGIRRIEQIPVEPRSHRAQGPRLSSCRSRNEIWKLKVTGTPTGGSFDIDVTVHSVTETVTLNYDDTAAEVETAFEGHSEIGSGQVQCSGGPFPGAEIVVEFIGDLAKKLMFDSSSNIPVIDDSGLTGGTSPAAWIEFPRSGHGGNANQ